MEVVLLAYASLIALLWWGWHNARRFAPSEGDFSERVSIVIALRNEALALEHLLESLYKLKRPKGGFEIILVNDHSEDQTTAVYIKWVEAHADFPIRMLHASAGKSGKKAALAAGIASANGVVILTTDADCWLPENWAKSMSRPFANPSIQMAVGQVAIAAEKGFFNQFQSYEYHAMMAVAGGMIGLGGAVSGSGANLAFRKTAYEQIGGYSGHDKYASGDDVFLIHDVKRLWPSGLVFVPRDVVFSAPTPSLKAFFHQRLRWGGKAPAYKQKTALAILGFIFFANALLVIAIFATLFGQVAVGLVLGLWLWKLIIDAAFLWLTGKNIGLSKSWYLTIGICYPFYLVLTGLLALFFSGEWKGRQLK
jgi:poly-beta-1,6-N-acetyl-D-glucosamine synthase